jgi:23S rRNA pseudouridine2605 synthase
VRGDRGSESGQGSGSGGGGRGEGGGNERPDLPKGDSGSGAAGSFDRGTSLPDRSNSEGGSSGSEGSGRNAEGWPKRMEYDKVLSDLASRARK